VATQDHVERGKHEERQEGGRDEAPDDYTGERLLDLRANPVRERGGEKADDRDDAGDDDRPEPDPAGVQDGICPREAILARLADRRNEDDAVQHAHPEHRDIAHGG
jgi:hypothetical protein